MSDDKTASQGALSFLDLEKNDNRFVEIATDPEIRDEAIRKLVSLRRIYLVLFAFSCLLVVVSLLTPFDGTFAVAFLGLSYAFFLGEDTQVKTLKALRERDAKAADRAGDVSRPN